MNVNSGRPVMVMVLLVVMVVTGCAAPPPTTRDPSAGSSSAPADAQPGRRKVLNLGLRTILDGFSIAASSTLQGGGIGYIEIHSQGLFTADKNSGRPVPRLVADHPTLENGGLKVGADGRMTATYALRRDVKWADGTPFTAKDMLFSFTISQDRSVPVPDPSAVELMESASAPDDHTFVLVWKQPYYQADALGPLLFWPLPAHHLEDDYRSMVVERKDVQAFLGKPYWTTEYFHIGPFKLTQFNQGVEAVFDRVDGYFLGRPKVDRIVVKQIPDANTLYANIISGTIDLSTDNALPIEQGADLQRRWQADQGGTVWYSTGPTWFVAYQFDPSIPNLNQPVLDKTVRQALYHAIDRDTLAEAVLAGIPGRAAHSMLSPDHVLHSFVKDGWKTRYPYDPQRAASLLDAAGWRRGPDNVLAHPSLGRLFIDGRTTQGNERKLAIVADHWRALGAEVNELVITGAAVRDREYRQAFPGMEVTARGNEDVLMTRIECAAIPTPANRFSGNNRGHWCNAEADRLINQYRSELRTEARGPIIKQLQDILLEELPIGLLNYEVTVVLARRGVTAFADDFKGGADSGRGYGTYSRNAHEWDVQ